MMNENGTFPELGIVPGLLEIVEKMGFVTPTAVQARAIPVAVKGRDVIGIARTGTGKTMAFGIPMVQRLAREGGTGLVIAPTRELAIQIDETIAKLTPAFNMKSVVLTGGLPMQPQIESLAAHPDIIVATPGRFIDHMDRGGVAADKVSFLVLDEADRMLDLGFSLEISEILRALPKERQTLLFSATMPSDIEKIALNHMTEPLRIEIAPPGTTTDIVTQEIYVVKDEKKIEMLTELLKQYQGSVLVFTRTKRGAVKTARAIKKAGFASAELHSDRTMAQRRDALEGFKSGKYSVLTATDIAARGIDVTGINLVVNYDLPDEAINYVHRIGRTGRAGMAGRAISLATPDQAAAVKTIENIIRMTIPILKHHKIATEDFLAIPFNSPLVNPAMVSPDRNLSFIRERIGRRKMKMDEHEKFDKWK
ncbi:MAG: DEAD/DEAH box helicase [Spirochaetia bacterium]|nr:DEAD/DEAH box helicase [Spirochaetia bacterium]